MAVGKRIQQRENDTAFGGVAAPRKPVNPLDEQYKLYEQAIQQDAGDRDSIMQTYKNQINALQPYEAGSDQKSALANLSELSQTGGLNTQDEQALRARGMAPIRSIYANANREVDRSRRLSGGFAPNYIAAKSRMARNLTSSLDDQLNNVNASIADIKSKNKISVAPQYAAFAENLSNAQNRSKEMGIQNNLQAAGGMANVYGTTPALTNTFGNAAQQASSMDQTGKARKQQSGMEYLRSALGRF